MKRKLLIIGAGDVGKYIAYNYEQFSHRFDWIGILDDDQKKIGQKINGWEVVNRISAFKDYLESGDSVVIGVAEPETKKNIYKMLSGYDLEFPAFVSDKAWLSNGVSIGKGVIIYPGVSINHSSRIGDFTLINMNCALGHDADLGNFCFLSPGVNLGGFTKIEAGVFMGIGSATKQSITIGENSKIGGQAMVLNDVTSNSTVVGIPAINLTKK